MLNFVEHLTGWYFFILFGVRDTPRCRGWAGLERPAQLSDVALANIEAIAGGEGIPSDPCSENKFHDCTFNVMNPNGEVGSLTLAGYIKVEK